MGKEAASAFGRWFVLNDYPVQPVLTAVCDLNPAALEWYRRVPTVQLLTTQLAELLASDVEVVYVAVPHHLHEEVYLQVLKAGKDLLAEKPFGIDLAAAERIAAAVAHTGRFVRCSSEFPFLPGPQAVVKAWQQGGFGKLLHVHSGFHHSSDLDPNKSINWKRQVATCGAIGVMGDLGMHAVHLPLRLGIQPQRVYAHLQKIYHKRPDGKGGMAPCDTWDNAWLHCSAMVEGEEIPLTIETRRMAPTETNTWFIEITGTDGGIRYSTKHPKSLHLFRRGKEQEWATIDLGFASVFPTITGGIFEPGFPDCFLQMLAAFFAERAGRLNGRFGCATVAEAVQSHRLFAAALQSAATHSAVPVSLPKAAI